jgi:kynurenine formamidase
MTQQKEVAVFGGGCFWCTEAVFDELRGVTSVVSGYAGGDAPGVRFENCYWCQDKQIAAICTDTWGVEVRPNETTEANQPWHWVVIPAMGLCMGEIFYLQELAEDCDADGIYEFFFCGPPLIITGGTGSPINPIAIF